jgi:hypothetical protein
VSSTEEGTASRDASVGRVDLKFEVQIIPVPWSHACARSASEAGSTAGSWCREAIPRFEYTLCRCHSTVFLALSSSRARSF